ncbi:MAG: type II toxin-antitoxin system RelE family toxin [Chloroflexota bacterium]
MSDHLVQGNDAARGGASHHPKVTTRRAKGTGAKSKRIANAGDPRDLEKPPRHDKSELWRFRVRDYRVNCELQEHRQTVLVVGVGHWRDVYE